MYEAYIQWDEEGDEQISEQSPDAFVEDVQILDASLMANEIIDSILKKKQRELCAN